MRKPSLKPVLLSRDQFAALQKLQEEERQISPLGIAPSIHEVARRLMEKALHPVSRASA